MARFHGKRAYMGAWSYVLHELLYAIPVIGWIFLLVHCFSDKDENRRHYARSFFAKLLLGLIITAIVLSILYLTAGRDAFLQKMNDVWTQMKDMETAITAPMSSAH